MSDPGPTEAPVGQLVELAVSDLGIIERARLVIGAGMTALTGETGAGKTLIVGAIDLLLGGRADPAMVREGCAEAVVEGRFLVDGEDVVLTRVVPRDGRSRAYVDGRMATNTVLGEQTARLVDLHGQHAHQSLLAAAVQRRALDAFAGVDLGPLRAARARRREIADALAALGGDAGARAREIDLVRFQLDELDRAAIDGPDEDEALDAEEDVLADASAHREAAQRAVEALTGEQAAVDGLGAAVAQVAGRGPFATHEARLRSLQAEALELAGELRSAGEAIEDDPGRLAVLRERRQLLADLRRKYASAARPDGTGSGGGELADVLAYAVAARERLAELEGHDQRAEDLDRQAADAEAAEGAAAAVVGAARRAAAPALAAAVEGHLAELAMADARFEVRVGPDDPGDDVTFLLAANPGASAGPLAKVASGGELARAMLALRLVLSAAPSVLVFDEVDAGIGGTAAVAVGRALARLGADHQVLVVTHLPQVAAFADHQVTVRKDVVGGATLAAVTPLDDEGRVVELARMLSGTPESERVQDAATELLARAAGERRR